MTADVVLGLLAALGSALALNWGYWVQHGAAAAMPPLSLRRAIASLLLLFAHRRWLIGFLVGIGGWVLYVGALKLAALSLVQSVSAGGIGVLALLAWRFGSSRPARRDPAPRSGPAPRTRCPGWSRPDGGSRVAAPGAPPAARPVRAENRGVPVPAQPPPRRAPRAGIPRVVN